MLLWDKPEVLEGLTTYRDERDWTMFYVLPSQPRFRLDDSGMPVFKFLKYRFPVDRPDGKKGGGFLIFDVEFAVPDDKLAAIKDQLQQRLSEQWRRLGRTDQVPPVKIGQLTFLRGAASLQFLDSGGALVEKVQNPGSPSLYGKMVTPFTVELSPEGATLAEQALQDKGGVVQVNYDLWLPVKLPPVTVHAWFHASKVMEFHQSIDVEERFWSEDDYKETIREKMTQSDMMGVNIDPGAVTDRKVIDAVRDWAWSSLEQAIARNLLGEIAAQDPKVAQEMYTKYDFENVERDVRQERIVDISRRYREGMVMEWNPAPRGTLPNITSLPNVKWADFAKTVDLNDPFFRQLTVNVRANADFESLPLDSIEVKMEYKQGSEHAIRESSLRKPDDVDKFTTFIANDSYKYTYSYQVNYKNSSQRFESKPVETDERFLTINVGDTGILLVEVAPGDINFNQVKEAQVTLRYEDAANGVPPSEQIYRIDKDHLNHRWVQVIFKPKTQPVRYHVKYFMADGREFETSVQETLSPRIFINDPFSATRTVGVRGFGDFAGRIDTIFVDLKYTDEKNKYSQSHSAALNAGSTFFDWAFPVIDAAGGKVTYSANIRFKDGTVEEIAETEAKKDTIMLGDVLLTQPVEVMADLVDFTAVKLVKVTLHYKDEANGIDETQDMVFKKDAAGAQKWAFPYKDKTRKAYSYSAAYFFADGSNKKIDPTTTTEETLVLPERPA